MQGGGSTKATIPNQSASPFHERLYRKRDSLARATSKLFSRDAKRTLAKITIFVLCLSCSGWPPENVEHFRSEPDLTGRRNKSPCSHNVHGKMGQVSNRDDHSSDDEQNTRPLQKNLCADDRRPKKDVAQDPGQDAHNADSDMSVAKDLLKELGSFWGDDRNEGDITAEDPRYQARSDYDDHKAGNTEPPGPGRLDDIQADPAYLGKSICYPE